MTTTELEKVFGKDNIKKCKFISADELFRKNDIPEIFDNYAVFIGDCLGYLSIKPAKIMPSKIVKMHGVLPRRKGEPKNTFNCCIGDYEEEQCEVWLKDIVVNFKTRNDAAEFNARPMVDKHALATCRKDMIGKWHEHSYGQYGFFKTKKAAVIAIKKKYEKELAYLESQVEMVKDKIDNIDDAFQEASK